MREALCVPVDTVRRTEDAFVDELFSAVPEQGGILVAAKYARTVADLNRDPRELDPNMSDARVLDESDEPFDQPDR